MAQFLAPDFPIQKKLAHAAGCAANDRSCVGHGYRIEGDLHGVHFHISISETVRTSKRSADGRSTAYRQAAWALLLPATVGAFVCKAALRRSAASYAESVEAGNGAKLLGHRSTKVFQASYNDATISGQRAVEPPGL